MSLKRLTFISFIWSLLLVIGCKSDFKDIKEITTEDLLGEWEIYDAVRNGKSTKSLETGNFIFQADSLVLSNLFATQNSLNFTYNKGIIKINGDPNIGSLKINQLQNDTLVLSGKMNVFDMKFYLTKK
jgi:hypothetical protein